jgi:uncharacterized protein (DUF433 family)
MTMSKPDHVKLIPAYSLASAARLLGSNSSTLRDWFHGHNYSEGGERKRTSPKLLTRSKPGQPISFLDLVEAHVFLLIRKQYRIPMKKVRTASETLGQLKGGLTFLAHQDFYFDSKNIFLQIDEQLVSLSERGQIVEKDIVEKGLKQLNYGSDGFASEFFPKIGDTEQREFVISPNRNFGRLCIARSGISADIIAVRFDRGEKISDIAQDYAATADEIEQAIRWHNRLHQRDDRAAA